MISAVPAPHRDQFLDIFPSLLPEPSLSLFFWPSRLNLWYLNHTPNFQCQFHVPFRIHLCALSRLMRSIELGTRSYSLDRVHLCTTPADSPRCDMLFVIY